MLRSALRRGVALVVATPLLLVAACISIPGLPGPASSAGAGQVDTVAIAIGEPCIRITPAEMSPPLEGRDRLRRHIRPLRDPPWNRTQTAWSALPLSELSSSVRCRCSSSAGAVMGGQDLYLADAQMTDSAGCVYDERCRVVLPGGRVPVILTASKHDPLLPGRPPLPIPEEGLLVQSDRVTPQCIALDVTSRDTRHH